MVKYILQQIVLIFVLLFTPLNLFSQVTVDTAANDEYIVLFIHGWGGCDKANLFHKYFDSVEILRNKGWRNVVAYSLYDNMRKEPNDDLMSDLYMREIGDFNTGSKIILKQGNVQQCFISLAKCEWVYRKSSIINAINDELKYEKLLSLGPRFIDLLVSAAWIESKLDPVDLTGVNKADLAAELYTLAQETPNRFRLVCHSMGGMIAMRFLTAEWDPANGKNLGFYKKYQQYKDGAVDTAALYSLFDEEIYNASYYTERYEEILAEVWLDKLHEILEKERVNEIEKVITLDSPPAGRPSAQGLVAERHCDSNVLNCFFL